MIYFGLKPIAKFLRMKDALAFSSSSMSQVIKSLFANGEQGFAFDFNDLSTMYQDSAGTIPVTGVGQPVGLVLDKSKGLVRGNLICGNNELKNPNYWTTVGTGWSFSNDKIVANNADKVYVGTINKTVQGAWYEVIVDVTVTSGQVLLPYDGSGGNILSVSTSGTYKRVFCSTNNQLVIGYGYTFTGSINSVTVKELPGNHATQSTSAKRPILKSSPTQLNYDGIDDVLTVNLPAQLTGCTVIRAVPNVGTQILANQTIAAPYNSNTTNSGLIVVNRALTSDETARVAQVFNKLAGV